MSAIPKFDLGRFDAVAIGSSTGGPGILHHMFADLPADLPVPIFLAQHMPPNFTKSFSVQLDNSTPLSVVHSEDAMPIYPGVVYVGVGHQHMRVRQYLGGTTRIEINPNPTSLPYKPSADELFRSCAKVYGSAVLAVVLTGIGSDGTLGATEIHKAGGVVITQSERTCAVYGMPKSCEQAGISHAQLDPMQISKAILQLSPKHQARAFA